MTANFYKFPSTPHLDLLEGVDVRGDKVMSETERTEFLQNSLVIEEKIDGANLGLSFDTDGNLLAQSRGSLLQFPFTGQWKKLGEWIDFHRDVLFENLSDQFTVFGEWCYATHSIYYDRLPDWFLGFDIYDKQQGRFFSTTRRDILLGQMVLAQVPIVARGHLTFQEICRCFAQSKYGNQQAEGLYLRIDHGNWLTQRAKLVRSEFMQTIDDHWANSQIRPNRLRAWSSS